jgi:hypothetical protein
MAIEPSGHVEVFGPAGRFYASLEGITFRAAQ